MWITRGDRNLTAGMTRTRRMTWRLGLGLLAFAALSAILLGWGPDMSEYFERAAIEAWIDQAGIWGPLAVILLMIIAVVASPLPSAPVALAAGAAYGHYAGALYVAIGAELGAMLAFLIARHLGAAIVARILGDKTAHGLLGSQNALTLAVFVSRLLPFVSFDAVSYLAGLSRIHLWRFLLATLAGILPASFVLAHLGAEAMSGGSGVTNWLAIGLGLLTAAPLVFTALEGKADAGAGRGGGRTGDP